MLKWLKYFALLVTVAAHSQSIIVNTCKQLESFPIEKYEADAFQITRDDWNMLLKKNESTSWNIKKAEEAGRIEFVHATDPDHSYIFQTIHFGDHLHMVILELYGQMQKMQFWRYQSVEKKWSPVKLPAIPKVFQFAAENVLIPDDDIRAETLAMYGITYEMSDKSLAYAMNHFWFIKEVLPPEDYEAEYHLFKYKFDVIMNGDGQFELRKTLAKSYNPVIDISAELVTEDPQGPGISNFDCPSSVSVKASSELSPQSPSTYRAANVLDEKDDTAWAEAKPDDGIGEWIEFTNATNFVNIGSSYHIKTGYAKNKSLWGANNRVKTMDVYFNEKLVVNLHLQDTDQRQYFNLFPKWLKSEMPHRGDRIKFVIKEIYKGTKYSDTLISLFVPQGNCG